MFVEQRTKWFPLLVKMVFMIFYSMNNFLNKGKIRFFIRKMIVDVLRIIYCMKKIYKLSMVKLKMSIGCILSVHAYKFSLFFMWLSMLLQLQQSFVMNMKYNDPY